MVLQLDQRVGQDGVVITKELTIGTILWVGGQGGSLAPNGLFQEHTCLLRLLPVVQQLGQIVQDSPKLMVASGYRRKIRGQLALMGQGLRVGSLRRFRI